MRLQRRHQLFEREFAFTSDYDIRSGIEILSDIRARFRPADDGLPAGLFCDLQRSRPHWPGSSDLRRRRALMGGLVAEGSNSCCRDENVESNTSALRPFLRKMRADIKDPQRWIGLHNLKLLGILVKEVTVSEKNVHV